MFALIKKYNFFVFCLLIFIFLRLPSLFEPYWYGDEGIYLVLGQAIRKGLILYSQIHDNKPPTLYYFAALSQSVFGFRLLLAFSMAGAIYYFYKLSQKLFSPKLSLVSCFLFLIFSSIPLIEGNIANAEVFMLLPTIAGIYYFLFSHSRFKFLVSGFLLGIAFTIKITVFVELVFICFWLLITSKQKFLLRIKDYGLLFTGFITPFLAYLFYFFQQGAVSDFIYASILQNFGYLSSWQTGTHSGSTANSGLIVRAVFLVIFYLLSYVFYHKNIISKNITFITLWFAATIFGSLLSTRPYPHYLIQVLPPIVLLITSIFDQKVRTGIRVYILFLLFIFSFFVNKYKFYFYPVIPYYQNFYSYIIGHKNHSDYQRFFGDNISDTYSIANYVKNISEPNEKIFVWGDNPFIYALSSRLPIGRFTVAYHIVDFNQYNSTYNQILINFPKVIVYYPQPGRPFPQLERILTTYYQPENVFGEATIYIRHDP